MAVNTENRLLGEKLPLRGGVSLAHFFLSQRLSRGDIAVDATCGNGKDTLFLAHLAGPEGRVYALDTDPRAVAATDELLRREGVRECVTLLERGHEHLSDVVDAPVAAVVFNLGYLPGADGGSPTVSETTLAGLSAALKLLALGGVLLVCIYTGHNGGSEEAAAVESWGEGLPPREWNVWRCRQLNRPPTAPYLLVVERNPSGSR